MNQEEKTIIREILIEVNNSHDIFDYVSSKLDLDYPYLTEVIDKAIREFEGE